MTEDIDAGFKNVKAAREHMRQRLVSDLQELAGQPADGAHQDADNLLLAYIGDADVTEAFKAIEKWYA